MCVLEPKVQYFCSVGIGPRGYVVKELVHGVGTGRIISRLGQYAMRIDGRCSRSTAMQAATERAVALDMQGYAMWHSHDTYIAGRKPLCVVLFRGDLEDVDLGNL